MKKPNGLVFQRAPSSTVTRTSPSKAARIIDAAGQLFREHGYALTSMEAVASRADVSKATLYQYFEGKSELFAAVIGAADDRHSHALIPQATDAPMLDQLLRVAHIVVDLLLAPDTIASYRMIVAEAARVPRLADVYYQSGAGRLLQRLETFFSNAMARGDLRADHPRRAAEQFIGLVRGDLQLRALLGLQHDMTSRQKESVIKAGVDTFYRAYACVVATAPVSL